MFINMSGSVGSLMYEYLRTLAVPMYFRQHLLFWRLKKSQILGAHVFLCVCNYHKYWPKIHVRYHTQPSKLHVARNMPLGASCKKSLIEVLVASVRVPALSILVSKLNSPAYDIPYLLRESHCVSLNTLKQYALNQKSSPGK
jgi:hypothetical protein